MDTPPLSPDPPAEETRRTRGGWLSRSSFRRKLTLIVGIPSAVALLGSAWSFVRVAATYQRAQTLDHANASSSLLIQAAAVQAKERGFTAAALSDPDARTARRAVPGLRANGDRLLDGALRDAQSSLPGNRVLSSALRNLLEARGARDHKRQELDAALSSEQLVEQARVQDWFDVQTRLITAERSFGSALFIARNPYEMIIQYNGSIKANVFVASEFAGRERARIGRFIARGQPIPPDRLEELQRWRGVVDENLGALAQLRANPAMSAPVLESIEQMETSFLGDYEKVRAAVYAASARHEPYPLTTDEWIAASTRGINSILAVSDRIGDEAARISHRQAVFSLVNVVLIFAMSALALLALVAAGFLARHLTRQFAALRAAADRVAPGDSSRASERKGEQGDEFAVLAGVFNAMQARVESGIEQLRAEKESVEAKVRERTHELSESNRRLAALNSEKDTFLGICSHDLKNPLSGVLGLAELLEADANDPASVRSHAADIAHSAEFMLHLVANLLDIGAIEQGKFALQPETVDLKAVIHREVESYRRRAADKQIRLAVSAPAGMVLARADARATRQIVDNLVSNAVKFTPPGGEVAVEISEPAVSEDPGTDGKAAFSVRDSGPGMSSADQQKLFQKYARLSAQPTSGESSTGLGLSIVKLLAEAMHGRVSCRSELGHGCTFAVELPLCR